MNWHGKSSRQHGRRDPALIDIVGAQIEKAAGFKVRAHRLLRLRQPVAAAFQFGENQSADRSGYHQVRPTADTMPSRRNFPAVNRSRYSPAGMWVAPLRIDPAPGE